MHKISSLGIVKCERGSTRALIAIRRTQSIRTVRECPPLRRRVRPRWSRTARSRTSAVRELSCLRPLPHAVFPSPSQVSGDDFVDTHRERWSRSQGESSAAHSSEAGMYWTKNTVTPRCPTSCFCHAFALERASPTATLHRPGESPVQVTATANASRIKHRMNSASSVSRPANLVERNDFVGIYRGPDAAPRIALLRKHFRARSSSIENLHRLRASILPTRNSTHLPSDRYPG